MRPGVLTRGLTLACVAFLVVPTGIVIVASFSSGASVVFPPKGFSFGAYGDLVSDPGVRDPVLHSLVVGLEAVVVGLLAGVPATLALYRHRVRGRAFLNAFLALGFSTPLIVSAIGFLLLFTELHVLNSILTVGFAIGVVNLPFMLWSCAAAMAAHDPDLEEAAATLGAEEVQQFLFVTLPSMASGIILGSFLIFAFGITEFVISVILVNVNDQTLPVYMFSSLRQTLSPVLAAVGALYTAFAVIVSVVAVRFGRAEQFLFRSR